MLYSHEYTQAAGRAGRLGLDTVGHVIHLNNLFRNVETKTSYKTMMSGKPPTLKSKFKISYNLLLNLIDIGDNNFINFARKSMVKEDLENELKEIYYAISKEQSEIETLEQTFKTMQTPITVVNEYLKLLECHRTVVNKKRKDIERQIESIHDEYVNLKLDKMKVDRYNKKLKKIDDLQDQYNFVEKYIDNNVETIVNLLQDDGFVQMEKETKNEINETKITLTIRGMIATHLKETHCLVFSQLFEENIFDKLNSIQIIMLLSCLTNIVVKDEFKNYLPKTDDDVLKEVVFRVKNMYNDYIKKESSLNINSGIEYIFHYDLLNYLDKWCYCENAEECKQFLQKLEDEKEIFLGEFVKALLKINNICSELEKIAELFGNMSLLSKLKEIPIMTLKYVVTNQSLYV
jgi:superfamily II RNA helicase